MKISYNWLSDYVPNELSPEDVAEMLTMSGLEVEDVEPIGQGLEGVVVGHVLETRPHPNADRLTVCRVRLGDGEPVQILCGAPNVAAGQLVPVATLGATLLLPDRQQPDRRTPLTIERRKIRGELSEGMICAEDELGISEDHAGIMVLSDEAVVGEPFAEYLKRRGLRVRDAVLDVSITPNRPDATSHLGIARDVAALTGIPLARPGVSIPAPGGEAAAQATVEIRAPEGCGRYVAMIVRGVRIGESPEWLKRRLTAVGLRPRNNVVDVTNYVMYECGQPLHAFDLNRLAGGRIVVRTAEAGEPFTTLDGKERKLPAGTLLICDAARPVAVAGVMGGENSEVTDDTTDLLIESAWFEPSAIRRAAKLLGLQTDASYRFERGVDPLGADWAAARAASLITGLAGGRVVPGLIDECPRPYQPREVVLRPSRVRDVLGVAVPGAEIVRLLEAIGFGVKDAEDTLDDVVNRLMDGGTAGSVAGLRCRIPSFRPDVEREIDVIEEIARLYGFHRIPEPERSTVPYTIPRALPAETLRSQGRRILSGLGFREIYTNSLLRAETARAFSGAPERVIETLNPISQEMAALRPSLLPGALQAAAFNHNRGRRTLRFFEFGHVFRRAAGAEDVGAPVTGYEEHEALLVTLAGPAVLPGWDQPERAADFFDLKGVVRALLEALRMPEVRFQPAAAASPNADYALDVHAHGHRLGRLAALSAAPKRMFDLDAALCFAELDWQAIVSLHLAQPPARYEPFSRFPAVERDLAVVVAREQPAGELLDAIREAGGPALKSASLFDLYQGDRIEAGLKSLAFSLHFGADRTLTDEEVDGFVRAVVHELERRFGARLRG